MTHKHIWIFGAQASPKTDPREVCQRLGAGKGEVAPSAGPAVWDSRPTTRTVPNFLFLPAALTPGLQLRDSWGLEVHAG